MIFDGIFLKTFSDESKIKISFVVNNGPLIDIYLKKDTPHRDEIDELSKIFYGKILDIMTRELLKEKGFAEQPNPNQAPKS